MAFSMEVVNPEAIRTAIQEEVKPEPEEVTQLKAQAKTNVSSILELDLDSLEKRQSILQSIDSFGMGTMKSSSEKNALLQVSVGNLSKLGDEGGQVAKGLTELQLQLKDLDPSAIDFAKSGLLGKLFNPLRNYFAKFQKADGVISDIIVSLEKGKTVLKNDNTTLSFEQQAMRDLTKRLQKEIELGMLMDQEIEVQIEAAKARGEA
ncbi:MAG: KlaA protein, partial [Paenibacillaceae bacterium]|nr:KlaA protein [Paenibacillaceae bacterium]